MANLKADITASTAGFSKSVQQVEKKVDRLGKKGKGASKQMGDGFRAAGAKSGDLARSVGGDTALMATGFGVVTGAIKAMKVAIQAAGKATQVALISTGIGAILVAIGLAIGAIIAYFGRWQEGINKIKPYFIFLQNAAGALIDTYGNLGDLLIGVFTFDMGRIKSAWDKVISGLNFKEMWEDSKKQSQAEIDLSKAKIKYKELEVKYNNRLKRIDQEREEILEKANKAEAAGNRLLAARLTAEAQSKEQERVSILEKFEKKAKDLQRHTEKWIAAEKELGNARSDADIIAMLEKQEEANNRLDDVITKRIKSQRKLNGLILKEGTLRRGKQSTAVAEEVAVDGDAGLNLDDKIKADIDALKAETKAIEEETKGILSDTTANEWAEEFLSPVEESLSKADELMDEVVTRSKEQEAKAIEAGKIWEGIGKTIEKGVASAFSDIIEAFVDSGKDGKAVLRTFGKTLSTIGKSLIVAGVADLGIKAALASNPLGGAILIPIGAALVATGALISASAQVNTAGAAAVGANTGRQGLGTFSSAEWRRASSNQADIKISGELKANGGELVAVINETNRETDSISGRDTDLL